MNTALGERIQSLLTARKADGLYRQRIPRQVDSALLSFSSNDYLSLANDPRLKHAYQEGARRYPVGSGGSPVVSGYYSVHQTLERTFAEALGVDDALYFSSGYAANLSLMAFFSQLKASVFMDRAIHASFYDGQYPFQRYQHVNLADLTHKIQNADSAVVVTESIFSMSGQISPLAGFTQLAEKYPFDLCVDEAHAFGVMGPEGLGLVHDAQLTQQQVPLRVIPLGKAYAGSGAVIAGKGDWIDALLQCARPYIYSTSPSPSMAYGLLSTLDIIRSADERRLKLASLIAYFRDAIQESPLTWRDSTTAIQQLQLGCPHQALMVYKKLLDKAIVCIPMRQPTVTLSETGLRLILNYHHKPEDIDYLMRCLH
jgi:8-amino-7-oxononanoate synthase